MKKPVLISFSVTWTADRKRSWKPKVHSTEVSYTRYSDVPQPMNQASTAFECGVFRIGIVWGNKKGST